GKSGNLYSLAFMETLSADNCQPVLQRFAGLICCPVCQGDLSAGDGRLRCTADDCDRTFPIVDGVPILIDDSQSVFSVQELTEMRTAGTAPRRKESAWKRAVAALTPELTCDLQAGVNYQLFSELLLKSASAPRVLVVGGRVTGAGMDALLRHMPPIEL